MPRGRRSLRRQAGVVLATAFILRRCSCFLLPPPPRATSWSGGASGRPSVCSVGSTTGASLEQALPEGEPPTADGVKVDSGVVKSKSAGGGGRAVAQSTVVEERDNNAPIDWVLARRLPSNSRRFYRKMIQQGAITVNGRTVKRFARVKAGQELAVLRSPTGPGGVGQGNKKVRPLRLRPEDLGLQVVYEDKYFAAVVKPPGMVVQPCQAAARGTVLHGLLHHLIATGEFEEGDQVAYNGLLQGISHRLDKETSGLVLIGKNLDAASKLSAMFRARQVDKKYLTICFGDPGGSERRVDKPLFRRSSGRVAVASGGPEEQERLGAKPAVSVVRRRATFGGMSLCEVEIGTGRMHQIRAHFEYFSWPIVGEKVYGDLEANARAARRQKPPHADVDRPLLHAWKLDFKHPYTQERLSLHAPMPHDMWRVAREILQYGGRDELAEFADLQPAGPAGPEKRGRRRGPGRGGGGGGGGEGGKGRRPQGGRGSGAWVRM